VYIIYHYGPFNSRKFILCEKYFLRILFIYISEVQKLLGIRTKSRVNEVGDRREAGTRPNTATCSLTEHFKSSLLTSIKMLEKVHQLAVFL
jgi:hypothetical protein